MSGLGTTVCDYAASCPGVAIGQGLAAWGEEVGESRRRGPVAGCGASVNSRTGLFRRNGMTRERRIGSEREAPQVPLRDATRSDALVTRRDDHLEPYQFVDAGVRPKSWAVCPLHGVHLHNTSSVGSHSRAADRSSPGGLRTATADLEEPAGYGHHCSSGRSARVGRRAPQLCHPVSGLLGREFTHSPTRKPAHVRYRRRATSIRRRERSRLAEDRLGPG